jgi:hypothetical protein
MARRRGKVNAEALDFVDRIVACMNFEFAAVARSRINLANGDRTSKSENAFLASPRRHLEKADTTALTRAADNIAVARLGDACARCGKHPTTEWVGG